MIAREILKRVESPPTISISTNFSQNPPPTIHTSTSTMHLRLTPLSGNLVGVVVALGYCT